MHHALGVGRRMVLAAVVAAVLAALLTWAAVALAFDEGYGATICSSNCHVQNSSGAHTFDYNRGASSSGLSLACQLFNYAGTTNIVSHGVTMCEVFASGANYVHARVYNQAYTGGSYFTSGHAFT